jgi:iron complex outermembrane receptor protein
VLPVALVLAAASARAADPATALTESDYYGDLPAVLSASRLAQSREDAPVATTIIDREMIEASGARNLADLFRLVPGMVVGYPAGFNHVVSYHGLTDDNGRRMQVRVDGREVYQPSTGGVPWAALPVALSDIERIEVVRGPNAATYGANSYLGVISITTLHTRVTPGEELRVNVGSHDIRDATLRVGGGDGPLHYRLTAGQRGDDGLSGLNDSSEFPFITARADWDASPRDDVAFHAGYNGGEADVGSGRKSTDPLRTPQRTGRYGQLTWRHDFDQRQATELKLYYSDETYRENFVINEPSLGVVIPTNNNFTTERFDGELQYTLALTPALRAALGAGARTDRAMSPTFFGTDAPLVNHLGRAFAHAEWHARDDVVVNAGAMWESSSITGSDFSPRLSLNWHATDAHTFRIGASGAVRTPVLFEEHGDWTVSGFSTLFNTTVADILTRASGGLKSEKIQSYELGYLGHPRADLTLDVRIFRDRLTDLISGIKVAPLPADCVPIDPRNVDCDARDFANTDTVRAQGAEFESDWQPRLGVRLRATYALLDLKSDNVGDIYSLSAPRHQFGLLGMKDLPWRLRASAAYYSQSSFAYLGEEPFPHTRRLDVKLARAIEIPGAEGEVALTGQSVLGQYPDGLEKDTAFDSRVFASIGLRFDN